MFPHAPPESVGFQDYKAVAWVLPLERHVWRQGFGRRWTSPGIRFVAVCSMSAWVMLYIVCFEYTVRRIRRACVRVLDVNKCRLEDGGKPSTWLPPGWLVEHISKHHCTLQTTDTKRHTENSKKGTQRTNLQPNINTSQVKQTYDKIVTKQKYWPDGTTANTNSQKQKKMHHERHKMQMRHNKPSKARQA